MAKNYKKLMENVPEEIQDFVYENYSVLGNKKERGVLDYLKQD